MRTASGSKQVTAPTRELESPRRFFKILQERALAHHKTFARSLATAGFEVRRIVRQAHHAHVWGLYLKRGAVPPGLEAQSVRSAVCAVVKESGVKLPPREIDVLTRGDRIEAHFIFAPGVPGALSFYQGREEWMPEPMEPAQEPPG
jgi:hypothetical protein